MKIIKILSTLVLFFGLVSFKKGTLMENINLKKVSDYYLGSEGNELLLMINLKKPADPKKHISSIIFKDPSKLSNLTISYHVEYTVVICRIKSR